LLFRNLNDLFIYFFFFYSYFEVCQSCATAFTILSIIKRKTVLFRLSEIWCAQDDLYISFFYERRTILQLSLFFFFNLIFNIIIITFAYAYVFVIQKLSPKFQCFQTPFVDHNKKSDSSVAVVSRYDNLIRFYCHALNFYWFFFFFKRHGQ
jgi:hypothetical protein